MGRRLDVVINGGGMVGLALANLLSETLSIAVIDPRFPKSLSEYATQDAFEPRVSAISRRSQSILETTGAWDRLPVHRLTPYQRMQVWESNGSEALTFDAIDIAEPNLGHIIENDVLRAALFEGVQQRSNISLIQGKISDCEVGTAQVSVSIDDGSRIDTKLLIGADGALSTVRTLCGFSSRELDYQQSALVANIQTSFSHEHTAWQRFLETGPIAYLPLPQSKMCSIVWSIDQGAGQALLALPEPEIEQRIAHALDGRLGTVRLLTPVSQFPLIARHSEHYVGDRVALVGDAAHTIHPLAGQGVNLGFADAFALAERINQTQSMSGDIGHLSNLRPYERQRKSENHLTQKAMTALNWVYQQQWPSWVMARNLGVRMINRSPMAKDALIRRATGV